jgi:hypothetical protein
LPHAGGVKNENAFGRGPLSQPACAAEASRRAGLERVVAARI